MVDTSPLMVDTSHSDPDSCVTYNLIKIDCCIDTFKNKEQRKFTEEKTQTALKEKLIFSKLSF